MLEVLYPLFFTVIFTSFYQLSLYLFVLSIRRIGVFCCSQQGASNDTRFTNQCRPGPKLLTVKVVFFALWSFLSGTEKVTAVTAPLCLVIFSSNFSSSCRSRQFKTTCLGFKSKFETVFELFAIKAYFCVSFVLFAWVQLVGVTQSTWPMQCIEFLSPFLASRLSVGRGVVAQLTSVLFAPRSQTKTFIFYP